MNSSFFTFVKMFGFIDGGRNGFTVVESTMLLKLLPCICGGAGMLIDEYEVIGALPIPTGR